MAKKNRQSKQPRRMPKQHQEKPEADRSPGGAEPVESGEGLMISESIATEAEGPSFPPPSAAFLSEAVPSNAEESGPTAEEEGADPPLPEEIELLTFNLEEEEYAVDIGVIQEITKWTEVTLIPRIQSYIKGIITLRGNVIPVFDMHARLGLAPSVKASQNRFIICATEKGMAAMWVDRVNDVVRLMRHRLESTPAGVAAMDAGLIKNIARQEDRLLILLDIEKTLQIDR